MKEPTVWEAEMLLEYIEDKRLSLHKYFLDVGSGDGVHQSNSRKFIQQGWHALLIDGLKENTEKCKELYAGTRRVMCLCLLVSDKEEDVFFEKDERHWALSVVKKTQPPNRRTIRLSKVLTDFMAVEKIGVMSLDVEANEAGILRDLIDNEIYPQIIIVEGNTFEAMREHRDILEEKYKFIAGVFPNQIFQLKDL